MLNLLKVNILIAGTGHGNGNVRRIGRALCVCKICLRGLVHNDTFLSLRPFKGGILLITVPVSQFLRMVSIMETAMLL